MPSPVQCSPFVVGRCSRSGRYCASKEVLVKSAPKPPVAKITGPCSWNTEPPFSYLQPTHLPASTTSLTTLALVTILALSDDSATFSTIWISAYVMVMPGKRSLPRCVRGAEWPPRRATRERSRLNLSMSHSTSLPLFSQSTLTSSGFLAPPFRVSLVKRSVLSLMPCIFCVLVAAPLMPLVALVELPPQKDDLSSRTTLPPFSSTVLAADMPPRPPPTTMAWSEGKLQAIILESSLRKKPSHSNGPE